MEFSPPLFVEFYSPLSDGSHFLDPARRMFATVFYFGYGLTRSQPANPKRSAAQHEWLTKRFAQFLDHQVNKTTGQFFPSLYEEYFAKWPPTPTKEDITQANGDVEVAVAVVRQAEERVRDLESTMSMLISS